MRVKYLHRTSLSSIWCTSTHSHYNVAVRRGEHNNSGDYAQMSPQRERGWMNEYASERDDDEGLIKYLTAIIFMRILHILPVRSVQRNFLGSYKLGHLLK